MSDVATALGLQLPPIPGEYTLAVVFVDQAVLPGSCFESGDVLPLPPELQSMQDAAVAMHDRGPLVLVPRLDPAQPPHQGNVAAHGTLFVCQEVVRAPHIDDSVALRGYALETVHVEVQNAGPFLVGAYRRIDWMPTVAARHQELRDRLRLLGQPMPTVDIVALADLATAAAFKTGGHRGVVALLASPEAAFDALGALTRADAPPPIEASAALRAAYERGFVEVMARQLAFAETVGPRWNVDVSEGTLDLAHRVVPLHLLGTTDPAQSEWLWSWAPQSMALPEAILTRATSLRSHEIPEFREEKIRLDEPVKHMLFIAQSHLARRPYFFGKGPSGPGIQCLVDEVVEVEPLHLIQAITRLTVAEPLVRDHPAAVRQAAEALGLQVEAEDDGVWRLRLARGGSVFVRFAEGRVASVEGGLNGPMFGDRPL